MELVIPLNNAFVLGYNYCGTIDTKAKEIINTLYEDIRKVMSDYREKILQLTDHKDSNNE